MNQMKIKELNGHKSGPANGVISTNRGAFIRVNPRPSMVQLVFFQPFLTLPPKFPNLPA
jgi:hypothetical protein